MFLIFLLASAIVYCKSDEISENSVLSEDQIRDDQINGMNSSMPKLLMANLIWRHGDRSPFGMYPTNPYKENIWVNGYGELTEIGMFQQYQLGQLLHSMYINSTNPLLSKMYNPREVYITSTDFNRTILSATCNLAGMFNNGQAGKDHPNNVQWPRGWTPIPVHVITPKDAMNPVAPCARADEIMSEIKNSEDYLKIIADHQDFLDFLSNKTGLKVGMFEMYLVYDVHFIQELYNMTQPEWFTKDVQKKIKNLAQISEHYYSGVGEKPYPEYIKLRGGRVLKAIIDRMNFKLNCLRKNNNGKECEWISHLKYHAFSAHDSTLMAIIATLGNQEKILEGKIPSYTASIAFELWDVPGKGPAIKVLYHNSANDIFNVITHLIDGCPQAEFCDLKVFENRSTMYLPLDIEEECRAIKLIS